MIAVAESSRITAVMHARITAQTDSDAARIRLPPLISKSIPNEDADPSIFLISNGKMIREIDTSIVGRRFSRSSETPQQRRANTTAEEKRMNMLKNASVIKGISASTAEKILRDAAAANGCGSVYSAAIEEIEISSDKTANKETLSSMIFIFLAKRSALPYGAARMMLAV